MTAFEIVLAGAILIAAAMQVVVLYFLYRVVARLADRTERLLNKLEPEIEDVAAAVRAVRGAVEVSSHELRSTLAGVRAVTDELGESLSERGRELARVAWKATIAAERQIDEADRALDRARERVVEIGRDLDRGVLEPVRSIVAVAMGVRRAIETLVAHRSRQTEPDEDLTRPESAPGT
jgi:nitrogen-specific signal transduction histidine kinase